MTSRHPWFSSLTVLGPPLMRLQRQCSRASTPTERPTPGVLLATFVATLVIDALKPWQKPVTPAKPITVDRYGPFLSPHPHHTPVFHVEHAPDEASAWAAILEKSA